MCWQDSAMQLNADEERLVCRWWSFKPSCSRWTQRTLPSCSSGCSRRGASCASASATRGWPSRPLPCASFNLSSRCMLRQHAVSTNFLCHFEDVTRGTASGIELTSGYACGTSISLDMQRASTGVTCIRDDDAASRTWRPACCERGIVLYKHSQRDGADCSASR